MLMRYPKVAKAGTKEDALVLSIDVARTFLDLAKVPAPADMHGLSLAHLLDGRVSQWRTSVLLEYFHEKNFPRTPTWQAVRTGRWKYIRYVGHAAWDELYDLTTDPHELKNRIADPAAKPRLDGLKAELDWLLKATAK